MDISIVSGTYNRLPFLKRMVETARSSLKILSGLTHEFVLVDGGSQDGTQDWCRAQSDVRLIEHEKLFGAVKAFNDGAFAAHGDYVVLANDDVEFLGNTLALGWIYMQDHPDCGIGCFYQDRNKRDWHVESMPVVRDGRQEHAPYGQVCIVPKWLGDRVGWWGDYLHTYGGDNELSSQVYALGFKVSPVPDTKVHDNEPDDDLRRINNITGGKDPRAVAGHHPDSWKWGKRWRNEAENLVGPVIRDAPAVEFPFSVVKERVLYLPVYEQGWPVQKEQKRGLREALGRVTLVSEYDYLTRDAEIGGAAMLAELQRLCQESQPTLVLTQIHNSDVISPDGIGTLRRAVPNARFVNWNGDFWPDNLLSEAGLRLARSFDLQTTVNRDALEKYREQGIRAEYWQIGWEPDGVGHEPEERFDLVFLASGYSPARHKLVGFLRNLADVKFGLWGPGWPDGWARGQNVYDFVEACRCYRGAKISLGDSQWPDSGFVSNRVFQALAAGGSALAYQRFRGMEELGLVDGETVIVWEDHGSLEAKVRYFLAHEVERQRIARAGEALALNRHSFDNRVQELFGWVGAREQPQEENWRW